MVPHKRGLILVGLSLLAIGAYSIYASGIAHPYQSTFNVLPLKYFKIAANLRDQTIITGQFQETSGRPVNFYIMSSVQFSAFQIGQGGASLYSLQDVPSAGISYTSPLPDTYYLVFTHGSGLLNTTETVNFQRTYESPDLFQLVSGAILVGLGILECYWGLRAREARALPPPPIG